LSAVAEAPSRNGNGPSLDASRYREAVKAKMKKREAGPDGGFRRVLPTDPEVDQFLVECQVYKLEPLAGQIYAVWENGSVQAVTTIDGMRLLAERTGLYDGQDDPEWCDKDGNWTDYWPGAETPLAARVRVHRKGTKVPTTGTANWSDFAPEGEVGADSLWLLGPGKPAHMLSIRAEALALRKAFPSELSGLYTAEELGISLAAIGAGEQEPGEASPVARDVPPAAGPPAAPGSAPAADRSPPPPGGELPSVIVDDAAEQPSGAPARPDAKRTLAETLADSEYGRLRGELTEALFDQMPDRLTDEQSELLASILLEAEEAQITPVEIERACKVAMKEGKGKVEFRSRAICEWISERRLKAEAETESAATSAAEVPAVASDGSGAASGEGATEAGEQPTLLDADPGPEDRR